MKAIMYHYVREFDPEFPYFKNLHVDDFKKQLNYFAQNFGFISKDDFLNSVIKGEPKKGVILTFDDSFKDHYKYVLPILKERGLWGIFYVPTSMYHNNKFLDVHRIHLLLGKYKADRIFQKLKEILTDEMLSEEYAQEFKTLTYDKQNNDQATNFVKRTLNCFISYEHREHVIDELMSVFFPEEKTIFEQFYMTPAEINEMQKQGMIIGSHTVNHLILSKLSPADQEKEIVESFNYLDKVTGGLPVRTFCYPYGWPYSFNKTTEKILKDNNCSFSFTIETKDIDSTYLKNRPQALPRYGCQLLPYGSCRKIENAPTG